MISIILYWYGTQAVVSWNTTLAQHQTNIGSTPANMRRSLNVGTMLGQRRRRLVNIVPTLGESLVGYTSSQSHVCGFHSGVIRHCTDLTRDHCRLKGIIVEFWVSTRDRFGNIIVTIYITTLTGFLYFLVTLYINDGDQSIIINLKSSYTVNVLVSSYCFSSIPMSSGHGSSMVIINILLFQCGDRL